MSAEHDHPTREDLLVMAFVDDELAAEQRELFQNRLAAEPSLARQVAAYQKLAVLARQSAPPEPSDLEWNRIQQEPVHQAGNRLGWFLLCTGGVGLSLWLCVLIVQADLPIVGKVLLLAPIGGFCLLLVMRIRDRCRLIPFDPYTEVKR